MSHPVSFVYYACGHATPVSESGGGTVKRLCADCAESNAPGIRSLAYVTAAMMLRDNQNTRRVP